MLENLKLWFGYSRETKKMIIDQKIVDISNSCKYDRQKGIVIGNKCENITAYPIKKLKKQS